MVDYIYDKKQKEGSSFSSLSQISPTNLNKGYDIYLSLKLNSNWLPKNLTKIDRTEAELGPLSHLILSSFSKELQLPPVNYGHRELLVRCYWVPSSASA